MDTIILDIDDTSADLRNPLCLALNKLTNKNIHWKEWNKFSIVDSDLFDISDDDFFDCIIKNKLLENLAPHAETKQLLTECRSLGYNIKIITSRAYHPLALEITEDWFTKYEIPYDQIIISSHGKKKADYIGKDENVILAIDDSTQNCSDFIKSGKVKNTFLYDMPWNKNSKIPRISSLNEIKKLL